MIPADAEGQAVLISSLAKRAYPSIELFVFALLCGAILGLGFLLDSQAVLLLGILLTPIMIPWVGFLLATLTGSMRFFIETSMALLISAILVFVGGLLSGFGARLFLPMTLTNLYFHARLWVPELIVLVVGAVTLVASFVRSEEKPFLPSVIIAYSFFLPVSAAGFGVGSGLPGVWPQGILVSLVHFALASVIGLLTLFVLKLRPSQGGYLFSGFVLLVFAGALIFLMSPGGRPQNGTETPAAFTPTNPPAALPTLTPSLPPVSTNTQFASATPVVIQESTPTGVSATPTPTIAGTSTFAGTATATPLSVTPVPLTLNVTLPPSETPTITLTVEIQPIIGRIAAKEGGGANLRQTPNGKYLMTLDNGTIVEVYPDFKTVNGVTWVHVFVTRNGQRVEGWLLESVVSYATPEPNFAPSFTPTP
jgi:hypothetical protein